MGKKKKFVQQNTEEYVGDLKIVSPPLIDLALDEDDDYFRREIANVQSDDEPVIIDETDGTNDEEPRQIADEILSLAKRKKGKKRKRIRIVEDIELPQNECTSGVLPLLNSKLFRCKEEDYSIVLLFPNDVVTFVGWLEFTVVCGGCKIFGCEKYFSQDSSKWTFVCSTPVGSSLLQFSNVSRQISDSNNSKFKLTRVKWRLKEFCDDETLNDILAILTENICCLIARTSTQFSASLNYCNGIDPDVFQLRIDPSYKHSLVPDAVVVQELPFLNRIFREWNAEPPLENLLKDAENSVVELKKKFVILIAGSTNTGKSTFGRYFTNCALNKNLNVFYLDCDCGQSEFTVPGCLALTKIEEPVFGAAFCHLKEPEESYYFGEYSPAKRIPEYLRIIEKLKTNYDNNSSTENSASILIVNTNGWTTNTGADLLRKVIEIIKPDRNVCCEGGKSALEIVREFSKIPMIILSRSPPTEEINFFHSKNAVNTKNLAITAYFGQLLSEEKNNGAQNLTEIVPYVVPWNRVQISVVHGTVPPNYLLSLLVGNVVALCRNDDESTTHWLNDEIFPKLLPPDSFSPQCFGFGIIRAVDMEKKLFYVLTPLRGEKLDSVNVFVKGAVCLPQKVVLMEASRFTANAVFCHKKNFIDKKASETSKALRQSLTEEENSGRRREMRRTKKIYDRI